MTDTSPLTQEQLDFIRELAYEKYVARGGEDGHHLEDWLAAEQEVLNGNSPDIDQPEVELTTTDARSAV